MSSPLTAAARHDPYAALRTGNFRWFVINILTLTIAIQIQGVVVAWQIYEVTHDPLSLGMIGLAEALPFICVALYAGHVADRLASDHHPLGLPGQCQGVGGVRCDRGKWRG
jgi:hypothetical protein